MALQELPLPVVHLAQGSSREEKRSFALALLLVFTAGLNMRPIAWMSGSDRAKCKPTRTDHVASAQDTWKGYPDRLGADAAQPQSLGWSQSGATTAFFLAPAPQRPWSPVTKRQRPKRSRCLPGEGGPGVGHTKQSRCVVVPISGFWRANDGHRRVCGRKSRV